MLLLIRDYMSHKNWVSIVELTDHFQVTNGFMQDMLSFWIKKGCVEQYQLACKKSCSHCQSDLSATYRWISLMSTSMISILQVE